jgi:Spy/CpxP family protein refolding chaperone
MLKKYAISVFALLIMFSILGCEQTAPPELSRNAGANIETSEAEFLLVAEADPLEIEQDEAFIIDGAGPFLFSVLDLTEEQKEQIKEIVHRFRPEFKGLRGRWNDGKSWEEIREERRALREQVYAAIYEILTDEQKAIIDEIEAQLVNGEFPDIIVEKRVEYLTEELGLSPDQQDQISILLKEYGNLLLAARNESDNPRDFRGVKFDLFQELDAKIREILTDEQIERYNQLKRSHGHRGWHRS